MKRRRPVECGKRYGKTKLGKPLVCRKDAGHTGPHAHRLPVNRIL